MGFAGAGVAEQHQGFTGLNPAATGQVAKDGGGEVGDTGVVEVGEPFGARELGLVDQPDPAASHSAVRTSARNALCDRRCFAAAVASCPAWARMVGNCNVFVAAAMAASAAGSASRDTAAVMPRLQLAAGHSWPARGPAGHRGPHLAARPVVLAARGG